MAESDSDDLLKHTTLPGGFFLGFGAKDFDPGNGRSPTSPLDLSFLSGLFSPRSPPPPSSPHRHTKWVSDKVGLSFLGAEGQSHSDHIVLAPQIKANVITTAPCVESDSLSDELISIRSHPLWDTFAAGEHNSPRRSSSSPMDILPSQSYSPSLSAREIALSEDYTCIISHGPNPKTTHMFGDCILDCDPKELGGLGTKDEIEKPEGHSLPDDDSFNRLCLCTSNPEDCQNIHIHREEELEEKGNLLEISPGSSYNEEDLFHMAMPLNRMT